VVPEFRRSGDDGREIKLREFKKLRRELGLFNRVLDDDRARRRAGPCRLRRFEDRPPRPCAPVLGDRAPIAAGAQMFVLDDVAALGAAGEAVEAAVAVEAQGFFAVKGRENNNGPAPILRS
jgi:hypothetical protein